MRRGHKSVVVGLAVFFVLLIGLGDAFRGYQAEVRLRGPRSEAIDEGEIRDWVAQNDRQAAVAIATQASGGSRVEIRIGRVASRLTAATTALDDLARRLLVEELPRRHAAHRQALVATLQADLQTARQTEESVRVKLNEVREKQIALQSRPPAPTVESPPASGDLVQDAPADDRNYREADASRSPAVAEENNEARNRLQSLKLELARLLANFTDEHPQVQAIRRQIASLEAEMASPGAAPTADFPDLVPQWPAHSADNPASRGTTFVATSATGAIEENTGAEALDAELTQLTGRLALAQADREAAEHKLQTTLATLTLDSPTAHWSAEPARLVARLGGTPRMLPLTLAILAGITASVLMFRATHVLAAPRLLRSAGDLAAALPIPLIGQMALSGRTANAARPTAGAIVTPARLRFVTTLAEIILLTILGVCVVAISLDPTLASQFAHDPFGVISEIVGRCLGR
jgi:hypothetical protein